MTLTRQLFAAALALASLTLAACGGGGGTGDGTLSPPTSAAQGLWTGTTSTGRTLTGLVLSDGSYYILYSAAGNANTIAGVVQGSGTTGSTAFTSSNAKDFSLEFSTVTSASISATFTAKQAFNGTIAYVPSGSLTFTSVYGTAYDLTPTRAALAGTYTGVVAGGLGSAAATVTVSSSGALTGTSGTCAISGSSQPRTDGNVYDVSITFGATGCSYPGQPFQGIAYLDAANKRLYAVAPNSARSDGVLFVGTKP